MKIEYVLKFFQDLYFHARKEQLDFYVQDDFDAKAFEEKLIDLEKKFNADLLSADYGSKDLFTLIEYYHNLSTEFIKHPSRYQKILSPMLPLAKAEDVEETLKAWLPGGAQVSKIPSNQGAGQYQVVVKNWPDIFKNYLGKVGMILSTLDKEGKLSQRFVKPAKSSEISIASFHGLRKVHETKNKLALTTLGFIQDLYAVHALNKHSFSYKHPLPGIYSQPLNYAQAEEMQAFFKKLIPSDLLIDIQAQEYRLVIDEVGDHSSQDFQKSYFKHTGQMLDFENRTALKNARQVVSPLLTFTEAESMKPYFMHRQRYLLTVQKTRKAGPFSHLVLFKDPSAIFTYSEEISLRVQSSHGHLYRMGATSV